MCPSLSHITHFIASVVPSVCLPSAWPPNEKSREVQSFQNMASLDNVVIVDVVIDIVFISRIEFPFLNGPEQTITDRPTA